MIRVLLSLLLASSLTALADTPLLRRDNLVAWCIVPFDAKKRGPEERDLDLLERQVLGIRNQAVGNHRIATESVGEGAALEPVKRLVKRKVERSLHRRVEHDGGGTHVADAIVEGEVADEAGQCARAEMHARAVRCIDGRHRSPVGRWSLPGDEDRRKWSVWPVQQDRLGGEPGPHIA